MKKLLILVLSTVFVSCHFSQKFEDREEDKIEAEKVTSKLFEYLKNGEIENATLLFDDEFFKITSKEELLRIFMSTQNKLGMIENVTLKNWNTAVSEGAIETGSYVCYYETKFSKGDAAQEISLRKTNNGQIKIVGYIIKSDVFN